MKKKQIIQPVADERLELLFRHAGLLEKQAKLYRMLLTTGEERASTLSKRTGIKRSNAYALLDDLVAHGLVTKFQKGKIIYYRPEPPAKLAEMIHSRKREANMAEELAGELVPELAHRYKAAVGRPVIRSFDGEEGIKAVFEDIYAPKTEVVYGCVDLEAADKVFPAYITQKLIPKRIKNQVRAVTFISDSPAARAVRKNDKEQLRTSYLLDKTSYPLPAEIDVYEDKIALLTFDAGEFIGLLIQNQSLATTLKSLLKLAFAEVAKRPPESDPRPEPAPPPSPELKTSDLARKLLHNSG